MAHAGQLHVLVIREPGVSIPSATYQPVSITAKSPFKVRSGINLHLLSRTPHRYFFKSKFCSYMCATSFGLYLGHSQTCQYKNVILNSNIVMPEDDLSTSRNILHTFESTV